MATAGKRQKKDHRWTMLRDVARDVDPERPTWMGHVHWDNGLAWAVYRGCAVAAVPAAPGAVTVALELPSGSVRKAVAVLLTRRGSHGGTLDAGDLRLAVESAIHPVCPVCSGTGRVECPRCAGSGLCTCDCCGHEHECSLCAGAPGGPEGSTPCRCNAKPVLSRFLRILGSTYDPALLAVYTGLLAGELCVWPGSEAEKRAMLLVDPSGLAVAMMPSLSNGMPIVDVEVRP